MKKLGYAAPIQQKETPLAIIALIAGLTSGPLAFVIGGAAGAFVPRTYQVRTELIGMYGWLTFSLTIALISLLRSRTRPPRIRSIVGIILTVGWAALFVLLDWWVSQLQFGPGL